MEIKAAEPSHRFVVINVFVDVTTERRFIGLQRLGDAALRRLKVSVGS